MSLVTQIDLSKIPAKETASKILKVNLDGTGEKEYRIHALDDSQRQCVGFLTTDSRDVYRAREFYVLLLASGLDVCNEDPDIARYILRNRNAEANYIANEIYQLTQDFYTAKDNEAKEAEKNSVKAETTEKIAPPQTAETKSDEKTE